MNKMKVLLTGASGLLGSDIAYYLENNNFDVIKLSLKDRQGYISINLADTTELEKIKNLKFDMIIHTSALRDPDVCEKDKEHTYKLNVLSTKYLVQEAIKRGSPFVFISTDYVFPGTNPPYKETDSPAPLNYYGQSKFECERFIQNSSIDKYTILRIPLRYGIRNGIDASSLLSSIIKAINIKREVLVDNKIIRYPTYTEDVAKVLLFLITKKLYGIFHYSGQNEATKYSITKLVADIIGKDSRHIKPLNEISENIAIRPLNSHLDCSRIFSLGVPMPLALKESLKNILKKERVL